MDDYAPLDLSASYNAGASILGPDKKIPGGAQKFRGLPFSIGDGEKAVVAFGKTLRDEPLKIGIGIKATYLIFAHRLLDTRAHEGGVGLLVATYRFRFADGSDVAAPIRDRFEIGHIPFQFGNAALLAFPDATDFLYARHAGKWGEIGHRQMEVRKGDAQNFYLWEWKNPHPDRVIDSLTVAPAGPRFYIGGITRSMLEETPLPRQAKLDVKISLTKPEDAKKIHDLSVEVDRGVATYVYPLPDQSNEEFLKDPFKGFGQNWSSGANGAYTEVAASPSATLTVKHGDEAIGSVNWSEVVKKGMVQPNARLRVEFIDQGRNWVHTTVLDDETGKPVSCRIHFRSIKGVPYQPHGNHNHLLSGQSTWHMDIGGDMRLGQVTYAYIDGKCQGWLPRGKLIVDIARGFEYEPIREQIELKPGQRELTFRLKRRRDMNKERYFSGDTHVHFLSAQGGITEASGEGLNVVNVLQMQGGHLFADRQEFTGRPHAAPDGQTVVFVSQENRQHLLGHINLLGLKKPVMPISTDGPSEAELGGNLETTVSRWADACHQQGGTVVIPHMPNPNCEPVTLIATGRADAVEICLFEDWKVEEYYRYLNCGYKLPITGGTDKMTSEIPVGFYRTYVHIPADEEFSFETWCKHLRLGNTFMSAGPLIGLIVEGQPIGSTLSLPGNGGTVEVEARADGVMPFHCLEIVMNGQVVARTEEAKGTHELRLREKLKVSKHSWIVARCTAKRRPDTWLRVMAAHTSPIYLAVGGEWWMFDQQIAQYLLSLMHGGLEYVRQRGNQWDEKTVTHHHDHANHLDFLEEPFRQAIQAVHKRMHDLGLPHG